MSHPRRANPATISPQIIMHGAVAVREWQSLRDYLWVRDRSSSPEELEAFGSLAFKKNKEGVDVSPIYKLAEEYLGDEPAKMMTQLLGVFRSYFARQVDRQMARKHLPLDPDYDVASLAFSIHGLSQVDDTVRESPFFHSCVGAVVEGQNPDGCWPEGMTVASHESSDAPPSTSDYADWCLIDGEKEVRAAGLVEEQREQILKRWSPHVKAAMKVKPGAT